MVASVYNSVADESIEQSAERFGLFILLLFLYLQISTAKSRANEEKIGKQRHLKMQNFARVRAGSCVYLYCNNYPDAEEGKERPGPISSLVSASGMTGGRRSMKSHAKPFRSEEKK